MFDVSSDEKKSAPGNTALNLRFCPTEPHTLYKNIKYLYIIIYLILLYIYFYFQLLQ